ncbi:hypothetical protein J5N97_022752 [Dioscorea zingiberensis]|uniref:Uncharacterized protein n=1 Tax=Dioscorea zingiberensis TaxID=325984 RepID=A0A9D5CBT1_9LILI|nr:hypothetical protein J5N97_022752 [Dioscorea zingiberensis]
MSEIRTVRMLMWEDGFCRTRVAECLEDIDGEDPMRKAFSKMSIQLYNYGEGWVLVVLEMSLEGHERSFAEDQSRVNAVGVHLTASYRWTRTNL